MASRAKKGRRTSTKRPRRPAAARAREKRTVPRIQPFVVPCRVIAGPKILTAYLTDLSQRGARVSSNDPLAAGARSVLIEVRLSRLAPASRLPARVRWRKSGRRKAGEAAVFGVTFAALGRADQARLRAALLEFRRRAALVA